jgi:hypothetical protein
MAAVAIAGTVVSVAAAGYGAYSSSQAAKRTGAAGDKARKDEKKAFELQKQASENLQRQLGQIQAPKWNLARDIQEAGQVTDYNVNQLEKIFPGAKTSRDIAAQTAISYQKGEIPKDVRDSIMRSVAELGGAGFSPQQAGQVGGFQAAQGLLGRQIGKMSVELSQLGNQISQGWQALAGSFIIESPLRVGQARLGYEQAAADIEMNKAQTEYNARLGLSQTQSGMAQRQYGRSIDTIGANLAADQAWAATGQALGSGMTSYASGFGAGKGVGTGSTAMTNQGFYKDQVGAANQYGVAPSQLSYQKGTGGTLGMGGQQGGYYYNPSGQYGRADIPKSAFGALYGAYGS